MSAFNNKFDDKKKQKTIDEIIKDIDEVCKKLEQMEKDGEL